MIRIEWERATQKIRVEHNGTRIWPAVDRVVLDNVVITGMDPGKRLYFDPEDWRVEGKWEHSLRLVGCER